MTIAMESATPLSDLLFSSIRILTESEEGSAYGTAFVFTYRPDAGDRRIGIPFLVTNRHVVEDAHSAMFFFLQATDEDLTAAQFRTPFYFAITDMSDAWMHHPDPQVDLSLLFLGPYLDKAAKDKDVRLFYRAVGTEIIPTQDDLARIDAVEDVYMVGCPNGIMDEVNYCPVVRRGITATPYVLDYQGRGEFLLDISVFPGSSGSPVFLVDRPNVAHPRIMFLGVLASGYFRTTHGRLQRAAIPASEESFAQISEMLDLGIAIKSHRVVELAESWLIANGAASIVQRRSGGQGESEGATRESGINPLVEGASEPETA